MVHTKINEATNDQVETDSLDNGAAADSKPDAKLQQESHVTAVASEAKGVARGDNDA